MNIEEKIKLFGLSGLVLERKLDALEEELGIDLQRDLLPDDDKYKDYYDQFPEAIRKESISMSKNYGSSGSCVHRS